MTTSRREEPSRSSRPTTTQSTAQLNSASAKGLAMLQLKQATRKLLRNPVQPKDRTVFNALAAIQLGPAGIFLPGDYDERDASMTTTTTAAAAAFDNTTSNNSANTQKLLLKQSQTTFFTQNVAAPTLSLALPLPGARFESTLQLAYCSDLLRRDLATITSTATVATPLDPAQQALVQPFIQNEEHNHVFGLVQKVVE
ncbi:hypothetical protein BGZ95_005764, partial [Linnemannia exigua]